MPRYLRCLLIKRGGSVFLLGSLDSLDDVLKLVVELVEKRSLTWDIVVPIWMFRAGLIMIHASHAIFI